MVHDSFDAALADAASRVEACLDEMLPQASDGPVAEAMRHATLNGGKRLRAFLVIEGARLFNVPEIQADRTAAAIECMHAYSLVHDDLPCMDDDDLRRGNPTVHKKWDEATAVLAGDALQTLAFEIMAHPRTTPDVAIRLKLIARLAETSGFNGMVGGQALDIAAEDAKVPLTLEEITALQSKKTGALISWAAEAGPTLGKSDISCKKDRQAGWQGRGGRQGDFREHHGVGWRETGSLGFGRGCVHGCGLLPFCCQKPESLCAFYRQEFIFPQHP